MSDEPTNEESREGESAALPEAQHQRWIKYGSNVALAVVLAIVLAGVITYIAQAKPVRVDTTSAGFNSLKPQTKNLIGNLNQNIKLVSLYEKPEKSSSSDETEAPIDRAGMVADLLDNYRRNSKKITVEIIDPTDKNKVDTLINDLYQRYGRDVANYKAFLTDYEAKYKQLTQLTAAESAQMANLANENLPDNEVGQSVQAILNTIRKIPDNLRDNHSDIDQGLHETHPDYKGITSSIQTALERVSKLEDAITKFFEQHKADADLSPGIKQYMTQSIPRHTEIKKIADDEIAKIGKLGELKIDELRRALNTPNPILVLGDTDWRIINENQVWTTNTGAAQQIAEGKIRPNFAGEQQVTTAIFSLTQSKKPKVVFLRPGGGPLTSPGFPPFQPSGPLSEIGTRLRQYNFDVVEKDLSGQWAMQSQARGMPAAPEPSWEEINDAVWVIIDANTQQPSPELLALKLAEHLGHGGSALVLVSSQPGSPGVDPLSTTLKDWGIDIYPDIFAVHEQIPAPQGSANTSDPYQDALRVSFIWDIKNYGDAELAKPLKNLDSAFVWMSVVKTHTEKDRVVTPIIPVPDAPAAPKSWGEKDVEQITRGTPPTFDPAKGDMSGPIYGGAISEKPGAGRLVVIGNIQFMTDSLMDLPNYEIARTEHVFVSRFPGNAELAMNSVFWLAKMDTMIAISPAAMQVSRIANMSTPVLEFWRVGVLLVLLPVLVIAAGIMTWIARRD